MSDKSPRNGKTAGSGKSIKEKRADKRAAEKPAAANDVVAKIGKRN